MAAYSWMLVLVVLLAWGQGQVPPQGGNPSTVIKRFEYKYSFKPPYLAQKDGTVPFFQYFGSKLCNAT